MEETELPRHLSAGFQNFWQELVQVPEPSILLPGGFSPLMSRSWYSSSMVVASRVYKNHPPSASAPSAVYWRPRVVMRSHRSLFTRARADLFRDTPNISLRFFEELGLENIFLRALREP